MIGYINILYYSLFHQSKVFIICDLIFAFDHNNFAGKGPFSKIRSHITKRFDGYSVIFISGTKMYMN